MRMKQEGFNYLEEKGLFTFYKEQEEIHKKCKLTQEKNSLNRQTSNDSYSNNKEYSQYKINHRNKVLHTFISLDSNAIAISAYKKEKDNQSPLKLFNHKKINTNKSYSSKKTGLKSTNIVELSFEAMSARKQVYKQAQYILKARAKTQASQVQINKPFSPLKVQHKPSSREYSKFQNNYFSQKIQRHSPKKSTIFFRLKKKQDALLKSKSSNTKIKPFLATQLSEISNQNLVVKGVQDKQYQQKIFSVEVRKAELLPQLKKDQGSTIDFWEYFQERKIFFINRYKKAKANKMRQFIKKQKKNNLCQI